MRIPSFLNPLVSSGQTHAIAFGITFVIALGKELRVEDRVEISH
ncbi:hypothetical protein CKA32_003272 [Geitlerinema sp. FC II]|nr:hypothetical protein CKA32_003272 [Geitlerinema sp. FC II]